MSQSNKNMEAYIAKILEIQQAQSEKPISENEMKQIATELGFSTDDWQKVDKTYEDLWKRGNAFVQHKNWEDALHNFHQALVLKPYDPSLLYMIASAYEGRWKELHHPKDKEKAHHFADQCLQIKADHAGAIKLISDLKRQKPTQPSPKTGSYLAYYIIGGILFLFFTVGWFSSRQSQPKQEWTPVVSTPVAPEGSSNSNNTSSTTNDSKIEDRELPVSFIENEKSQGLTLSTESSIFHISRYDAENYSFRFLGDLIVKDIEVSLLKIKIELLDSQGKIVKTDFLDAISDYNPKARNGDNIPLAYFEYKSNEKAPDWKSAQLSVEIIQKQSALNLKPENYPSVTVKRGNNKSANFDLKVFQRESRFTPSTFGDKKLYHKLELDFKNTGNYAIKSLKAEIQWFDQQNKIIDSKTIYVNTSSNPSIKKGQGRVFEGTWALEKIDIPQIKNYEVVVTEIE
ncbi:MAG: hypothetical protein NW226_13950 [Microscillaceae bacterium]|nr:hypothetical protein [Microscillaceae bacterium]